MKLHPTGVRPDSGISLTGTLATVALLAVVTTFAGPSVAEAVKSHAGLATVMARRAESTLASFLSHLPTAEEVMAAPTAANLSLAGDSTNVVTESTGVVADAKKVAADLRAAVARELPVVPAYLPPPPVIIEEVPAWPIYRPWGYRPLLWPHGLHLPEIPLYRGAPERPRKRPRRRLRQKS
jgi:hypothetical protein